MREPLAWKQGEMRQAWVSASLSVARGNVMQVSRLVLLRKE